MLVNIHNLAQQLLSSLSASDRSPMLIGLAGIPGAGKSTLTTELIKSIFVLTGDPNLCTLLPMDGYHFTRAQLRVMPNSEEAFNWRSANIEIRRAE